MRGGLDTGFWASRVAVSSRIVLKSPEVIVDNVSNVVGGVGAFDMMGKFDVNISPNTGLSRKSNSSSRPFIRGGVTFSWTGGVASMSLIGVRGLAGSGIVTARGTGLGCRTIRSIGLKDGDGCGDGGSFCSGTRV